MGPIQRGRPENVLRHLAGYTCVRGFLIMILSQVYLYIGD